MGLMSKKANRMAKTNVMRAQEIGRNWIAGTMACLLAISPTTLTAQQAAGDGSFTLKVKTDIVLTNVVVRDKKSGQVVKGLKASDFTIMENGKPQTIASFDYQNVDEAAVRAEKKTVTGKASIADIINRN